MMVMGSTIDYKTEFVGSNACCRESQCTECLRLWHKSFFFFVDLKMTYIVNDKCIGCKHTDCVEVCPWIVSYEGENTLVINPDECIDCGVCELNEL